MTEGVDISSSFRGRSLLTMTLHFRTQDERFCGSRKNFRNPLLVVRLGSAVKAPSEPASAVVLCWCTVRISRCFERARTPRKSFGRHVTYAADLSSAAVEQLVKHEAPVNDAMKAQYNYIRYIGSKCSRVFKTCAMCAQGRESLSAQVMPSISRKKGPMQRPTEQRSGSPLRQTTLIAG